MPNSLIEHGGVFKSFAPESIDHPARRRVRTATVGHDMRTVPRQSPDQLFHIVEGHRHTADDTLDHPVGGRAGIEQNYTLASSERVAYLNR